MNNSMNSKLLENFYWELVTQFSILTKYFI